MPRALVVSLPREFSLRVPDKPLPGDLVIRSSAEWNGVRRTDVWIVQHWPETEVIVAGPYQSYGYAFAQAKKHVKDRHEWIWRDHARAGEAEQLELVGGG
jgi:hypothetical protein